MNKTDFKYKEIDVSIGADLGKAVDEFLREDIEVIGIQARIVVDRKVAVIKYVPRDEVRKKYEENGTEFKEYNYANYLHTVEVSVSVAQDLSKAMNDLLESNKDIEAMTEIYYDGNNLKNVIILYTSRSEYEHNEAIKKAEMEEQIQKRAEEMAKQSIKQPENIELQNDVLDKYATVSATTKEVKQNETAIEVAKATTAKKVTTTTKTKKK